MAAVWQGWIDLYGENNLTSWRGLLDEQQLQTCKCSSMCLRWYLYQVKSFSEQVIRLRITMSSLVPPVLGNKGWLRTRKARRAKHASAREGISGDPVASRVLWFSRVRAYFAIIFASRRKYRPLAVYLVRSREQGFHVAVRGFAIQQFSHDVYSE